MESRRPFPYEKSDDVDPSCVSTGDCEVNVLDTYARGLMRQAGGGGRVHAVVYATSVVVFFCYVVSDIFCVPIFYLLLIRLLYLPFMLSSSLEYFCPRVSACCPHYILSVSLARS